MTHQPDITRIDPAKLRVLSLGAGVQSTTMALMAAHGEIGPMPDCAVFADTQGEPGAVYQHLEWLRSVLPFPVHTVTAGNLWKSATTVRRTRDGERTYISTGIPVYTKEGLRKGIGKRQCTRDFKIAPINKKCRELLGLKRITKRHGVLVEMWIGISADEAARKKPSATPWIRSRWPLLERDMDRTDCLDWCEAKGYPRPPRSACTYCPFHDDNEWLALTPEEFADVAHRKEPELQSSYALASAFDSVPFFHEARIPLAQIALVPKPPSSRKRQLNMFNNECEGMCGV